jgi:hypothetical protein
VITQAADQAACATRQRSAHARWVVRLPSLSEQALSSCTSVPQNTTAIKTLARIVSRRIRLNSLGDPTRQISESLGHAAALPGAPVERDAARLVVDAIKHWPTASGYLDPHAGLTELVAQLGLATATKTSGPVRCRNRPESHPESSEAPDIRRCDSPASPLIPRPMRGRSPCSALRDLFLDRGSAEG